MYIFRSNNELLISQNGKVEKGKWEYLGNNSLLIDKKDESYLFRHGFFDDTVLALKIDGKEEYAFLVNENKFGEEVNSIATVFGFLKNKYLSIDGVFKLIDSNKIEEKRIELGYKVIDKAKQFLIGWGLYEEIILQFNNGLQKSIF